MHPKKRKILLYIKILNNKSEKKRRVFTIQMLYCITISVLTLLYGISLHGWIWQENSSPWWSKYSLKQRNLAKDIVLTGNYLLPWTFDILASNNHLLIWQAHDHRFCFCLSNRNEQANVYPVKHNKDNYQRFWVYVTHHRSEKSCPRSSSDNLCISHLLI